MSLIALSCAQQMQIDCNQIKNSWTFQIVIDWDAWTWVLCLDAQVESLNGAHRFTVLCGEE
jgi:hypothetical protein